MTQEPLNQNGANATERSPHAIAHDLNNVLGVISNYAEFLREEIEQGSQAGEDLAEIQKAAEKGAGLTRELLSGPK